MIEKELWSHCYYLQHVSHVLTFLLHLEVLAIFNVAADGYLSSFVAFDKLLT